MAETQAEPKSEQPAPLQESSPVASLPSRKPVARGDGDHGGIYSRIREAASQSGGQEPPPEQFSTVFRKADLSHTANNSQKARALDALQNQYGNRYVQRVLAGNAAARTSPASDVSIQRKEEEGAGATSPGAISTPPQTESSAGHSLDSSTQSFMQSGFNHDFSGVRVHTDSAAQRAADSLSATAFTTGRDVYFNQGAYDPSSEQGRGLIAHELAHVAQQDNGMSGASLRGFHISQPDDPAEHQADIASAAVMRGEMAPMLSTSTAQAVRRKAAGGASHSGSAKSSKATGGGADATIGDYAVKFAGLTTNLPISDFLKKYESGGTLTVPEKYVKSLKIPGFKVTDISLNIDENKKPTGGSITVDVAIKGLSGKGTLNIDKKGEASGDVHINFQSSKFPGLKDADVTAMVKRDDFAFDANLDFDLPKITGNLQYKYQDHKHSGSGKAHYEGAKLKGDIDIVMSEAGKISGQGHLSMELFKGLQGDVDVAVDEKRKVKVAGKLTLPAEVPLFPEKRYEKSFFDFEKKFPLWGFTIPVVDINVGLFAEIHANASFVSKLGPGVLRGIELTGEFGTDPEAATQFGLSGEFFLPAAAEIVVKVGGGIGLGLAVVDLTGGIEAIGVAGLYTALSVKPNFQYAGGKYTLSGLAELGGIAQARFGINAFAKIDVGVWMFKGTVWHKDWNLAEWIWNTGLNVSLKANINYTFGEDFAPDISFETDKLDPEKFIKDVMPESGTGASASPKKGEPDKGTLTAGGKEGKKNKADASESATKTKPKKAKEKTQKGAAESDLSKGKEGAALAGEDPQRAKKVEAGLKAIKSMEREYMDEGQLEREDSEEIASSVKSKHAVFKSITVVDGGSRWDYNYVASPGQTLTSQATKAKEKKAPPGYEAKLNDKGNVEGSFDEGKFKWSGYPPSTATRHPANKYSGNTGEQVPKPTGGYEILPGQHTEGNMHTKMWRNEAINPRYVVNKGKLQSIRDKGKNKNESEADIKKKLLQTINFPERADEGWIADRTLNQIVDQGARLMVEKEFLPEFKLEYQDYNLAKGMWEEHHIHPVSWCGMQKNENFQYLKVDEHKAFTNFFNNQGNELKKALGFKKKKGGKKNKPKK
jgi:hypothetical protein